MMLPRLVAHTLDVRLGGAHIQERVINRLRELLRLDQESPEADADIAASIATAGIPARA